MTDRLSPEALSRASDAVTELYADGYCPKAEDAAEVAVSAYLAAATPEMDTDTLACKIMWKDLPFGGNPDNYIRLDANAAHAVIELLRPHLAALPEPRTITTVEEIPATIQVISWEEEPEHECWKLSPNETFVGLIVKSGRSWSPADQYTLRVERTPTEGGGE